MDYGITHQGKVYTPNGTTVAAADNDAHNREIEAAELARWATKPDRMLAYYRVATSYVINREPRVGYWPEIDNRSFSTRAEAQAAIDAIPYADLLKHGQYGGWPARLTIGERRPITGSTVTTWLGTVIGRITYLTVYRHNFGGRFISLSVQGTNGAVYYGRASWDSGTCVNLRRAK